MPKAKKAEFFDPYVYFGRDADEFRYGAVLRDENFADDLRVFLQDKRPGKAKPLVVRSVSGSLFKFFYFGRPDEVRVIGSMKIEFILRDSDDAYLFLLHVMKRLDHVGPPISDLVTMTYGSEHIWPPPPTAAEKRADCKAQGLVYDTATGKCRASKKGGKSARRSPRRGSRTRRAAQGRKGPTVAQKRADCKAQGLVYDTATGKCRASKKGGRTSRGRRKTSRRRRSPRRRSRSPRRAPSTRGCPVGSVRSPTGRCIKIGGAAYKKYFG